jgi:catechol 2,3-dioxygenase-like lactoylglutathione lyase family enzyme
MSNPAFKFDHVHIISKDPQASADWYVEMFGATIAVNTMARRPADLCRFGRNDDSDPRPAAGGRTR